MKTVTLCGPLLEVVEISREEWRVRWCFSCRDRIQFHWTVRGSDPQALDEFFEQIRSGQRPEEDLALLYREVEPHAQIVCGRCNRKDADVGFGMIREMGD